MRIRDWSSDVCSSDLYMEKLAAGADVADLLDLDRPIGETLGLLAQRRSCATGDLTVIVLDRPRHEDGIRQIREAGARVRLISDRKSVVSGKSVSVRVDICGRRIIKKKNQKNIT